MRRADSALSSTIKIFESIDQNVRGRNNPNKLTSRKLLQGGNDTLRINKEFYIPVSRARSPSRTKPPLSFPFFLFRSLSPSVVHLLLST
jgi:hypothetical protein